MLAVVVALATIYRIPSFERRDAPTYTATARLLVTGSDAPYIRTSVTRTQELQRDEPARPARAGQSSAGDTTIVQTGPPDVTAYVRAANLFPLLVESDQIRAERERLFGPTEGKVTARAIYAVSTPSRYTLSEVPVIQVFGEALTPPKAIKLTQDTADAFVSWMTGQQKKAGIPPRARILVQELQRPRQAIASPTASPMLMPIAFLGVAFVFGLLAVVVDRLRHPVQAEPQFTAGQQPVVAPVAPVRTAASGEAEPLSAAGGGAAAQRRPVASKSNPTLGA